MMKRSCLILLIALAGTAHAQDAEVPIRTEAGRRAKYYQLTRAGRAALGTETAQWRRYVDTVELILGTTSR